MLRKPVALFIWNSPSGLFFYALKKLINFQEACIRDEKRAPERNRTICTLE